MTHFFWRIRAYLANSTELLIKIFIAGLLLSGLTLIGTGCYAESHSCIAVGSDACENFRHGIPYYNRSLYGSSMYYLQMRGPTVYSGNGR